MMDRRIIVSESANIAALQLGRNSTSLPMIGVTPLRRLLVGSVVAVWMLASLGCNQTPPPNGSSWGYLGSPSNSAYMAGLQRRSDAQAELAAQKQLQLDALKAQHDQTSGQLEAMKLKEQQSRQVAARTAAQSDKDLANRAREVLGRYGELGEQAKDLDRNNRDLNTKLAQLQKRNLVVEDQNYLLRQRLKETSDQLAKVMQESQAAEQRLQAVQASTRRRGGATITANSSLQHSLTAVTVDGLEVRQDGELVRIELPANRLFEPGTATLQPGAQAQLDRVAEVILENYSRQVVGIEAHTDGSPPRGSTWRSAHQLTVAQALAVFEQIGERHRMLPQQLFVLGHGNNYPLVSSATVAGQERNRRVEIVIYPEPVGSR